MKICLESDKPLIEAKESFGTPKRMVYGENSPMVLDDLAIKDLDRTSQEMNKHKKEVERLENK